MKTFSLSRFVALVSIPLLPVVLAACANQSVTRSGFLGDYEHLASAGGSKSLTYRNADRSLAARSVVIEDIAMRLPADQAGLPVALQEQARADYRFALEKAFGGRYAIVDARVAGAEALHVRAAITGLKPSNPTLNVLTFLVVGPVSNGGVSTESEVVDVRTGARVAAQATYTNGHLFNGGLGGYFDALGHVRKAFDTHAEKLRDLVVAAAMPATTEVVARTGSEVTR